MKKLSVFLATVMLFTMLASALALPASAVTALDSVLNGKSALFVGDSIMTGWRDGDGYAGQRGWGIRMRDNYAMDVTIAATAGEAISTVRPYNDGPIYKQLEKEKNENNSYDYIILEGGFNDIMGNEQSAAKERAPIGTMSSSYDISSFNRDTFAGALEHLLCYATTNFPNAKIGYIVTFETPYSNRGNGTNDRNTTKAYFDLAKQICDKWNVPYLDFYDGAAANGTNYFDIFYPEGRTLVSTYPNGLPSGQYGALQYIADDIHPNKAGYDATYGYVAQWMATLPVYTAPLATADTAALSGKTAMFAGDSITYGYRDTSSAPRSWALRLKNNYGMTVTNNGQNGHSLSDVRDYTAYGNVDKRLHVKCFDQASYNYVILQGGVNDIIGAETGKGHPNPGVGVQVGSIAATKDPDDFDTGTFAGGLERYFYEATTRYPSARIGFIITYQTPNAQTEWGITAEEAAPYWQIAREICAKWDIPYLDLFDDSYSIDILKADTNQYLTDTLHLDSNGYDVISPYIAKWMATLPKYVGNVDTDVNEPTVTPTGTEYHYDFNADYTNDKGTAYYTTNEDYTDYNNCIHPTNGVDTRLISGGYNGAKYAMKMAYTKNLPGTRDIQHYASFSLPNTYSVAKNYRNPGKSIQLEAGSNFRITVRYKVTGYTSAAALYACFGSFALSNGTTGPTFSGLSPVKIADVNALTSGWQTVQVDCAPTDNKNLYIFLKMTDDAGRVGTEVLIGSIDIVPIALPSDTENRGTIQFYSEGGSAVDSISGTVGANITYPANPTREGYDFVCWYTADYSSKPDKFTEGTTKLFARWKAKSTGPDYPGTEYHYTFDNDEDLYNYDRDYYCNSGTANAPTFHNNAMWSSVGATAQLVSGGYNGSKRAMQMAYTANLAATADQQHYAAFSLPNNTGVSQNGRGTTQTIYLEHGGPAYELTVTYKVTDYRSPAALYFALGLGGLGDNSVETFSQCSPDKIADITATTTGWQTTTIIIEPNSKTGAYLVLKMEDDTNRAGTEVLIGAVDIVPVDATQVVKVTFNTNGGSEVWPVRGYMNADANYPVPTKLGYAFTGWYTADGAAAPATFPTADTTYYAGWAEPTIKVDSVDAAAGDTVRVNVRIAYNPGIISVKTAIGYDTSKLELTAAEAADFAGVTFGSPGNGMNINWMDPLAESNNTADGVLAVLTFRVLDTAAHGDTAITVTYDLEDVFDYDLDNVYFVTESGTVTVHTYDNASDADCNGCDMTREIYVADLTAAKASLSLQHNLTVNYKVNKELFDRYDDLYMVFEFRGKTYTVSASTVDAKDQNLRVFKFRNVAANFIGETITYSLRASKDGIEYTGPIKTYSVKNYCYNTLRNYATEEYAEIRTLLVDLLNYGSLSQQFTAYNTEALVNADLTEEQKAWATSSNLNLESATNKEYAKIDNPQVEWKSVGLHLGDAVMVRYKMVADSFEGITFRIQTEDGAKQWTMSSSDIVVKDNVTYLYFSGLNADEMSKPLLITAYKGNEAVSNTLRYSIESYAYSKQNDTTTAHLADLVKAMMKYGNSAYNYTH